MLCVPFAAAPGGSPTFPYLWATLPLVGVILLAAVIIAGVKKRWGRASTSERVSPSDQLSEFRTLYESGELSAEEFARIRNRLGAKLKRDLELPPATPASSPPPTEADPDASIRPGPTPPGAV
jgi:hypothetical protein